MGGTVAKMAEAGCSILSVIITDGRRAPDPDSVGPEKMAGLRKQESLRAAAVLGIRETQYFDLASVITRESFNDATERMIQVIESFEPEEIFTLHPDLDRHPSHRAAGKITIDAIDRNKGNANIRLWAYEVWGLFADWNRFENITDQMPKKLAAIGEHGSQLAAIPYCDGIEGLNRWRAVFADPHQTATQAKYAEVFLKLN